MASRVESNSPTYPIESVDNALRLLLLFREHPTLRVAEASRSLEVAPSTAHRLLAMLQYHGFVVQDAETKAYRAGSALAEIGLAVVLNVDAWAAARSAMEVLVDRFGETVHLGMLDRNEVLLLDSMEGTRIVRVGLLTGARLPAHLTSLGKAMLAHLGDERLLELYPSEILEGRTKSSIVRRKTLLRTLKQIAEQGYAVEDGEIMDDVAGVGMAILSPSGQPTVAMGVTVSRSRFDDRLIEVVVPALRDAAKRVQEQL